MKMTFEKWMKRPVYVAQCKTASIAQANGVFCFLFRALPGHRDAQAQRARNAVADIVRDMRKKGQPVKVIPHQALATRHHDLETQLAV
jgi:hypothetical protein